MIMPHMKRKICREDIKTYEHGADKHSGLVPAGACLPRALGRDAPCQSVNIWDQAGSD